MGVRLAWIGLGNMGQGMARNLITKGQLDHPLILYNRTLAHAESLANEVGAASAITSPSIEDAVAAADIVFTCLANDAAIQDTMEQALALNVSGKVFVDCTTVHPDVTDDLAALLADRGAQLVSLTVLGSPAVAATGQVICIASGPADAIGAVRSYTTGVLCRQLIEFRNEPAGKADLLKLIANTFILNVNEVVAEGLTFAEKADVEPRKLHELLGALFGPLYATYAQRMVKGEYLTEKPQVPIDMALKDAHHAQKIAADVGCAVPSLDAAERRLQAVKTQRGPSSDSSAVYGVCRVENGLPFEI